MIFVLMFTVLKNSLYLPVHSVMFLLSMLIISMVFSMVFSDRLIGDKE